ncbi:MAG: universal stress protein [Rickettsiales bacterium]
MYKNILVPVDVSEENSWAVSLPVALEYAKTFGSTLHFVTVIPDIGSGIVAQYFPPNSETKLVEETTEALHNFTEKHVPSHVPHRHIVAKGPVYEGIIDTAEEIDVDLILMEAHRPDLKDYLLGPNSAKVVRHSNRSVLVVRG